MKILVRLPNWLGDVVMSLPLLLALRKKFPEGQIDVIVKAGLDGIFEYFPEVNNVFTFKRSDYKGVLGPRNFGKQLTAHSKYDLYYNLPVSESSYIMLSGIQAKKKVGFQKGLFSKFLSKNIVRPEGVHRVNEYMSLLNEQNSISDFVPKLINKKRFHAYLIHKPAILININSEAESRTLPQSLVVQTINHIHKQFPCQIVFSGLASDSNYLKQIIKSLNEDVSGMNFAGKTNVKELCQLVYEADAVLSTDSGIAHIANAFEKPLLTIFGAGDDQNTAPFNKTNRIIYRKPDVHCAPCVSNTCRIKTLDCLNEITPQSLAEEFIRLLEQSGVKTDK